jgi:hypothetical protein
MIHGVRVLYYIVVLIVGTAVIGALAAAGAFAVIYMLTMLP